MVNLVGLLTGRLDPRKLPREPLTGTERELFHSMYNARVEQYRKVDPDLADFFDQFRNEAMFAAEVAKGHWHLIFGAPYVESGGFGMFEIAPRPFLGANDWTKSVSAGWNNFWGSATSPIAGNNTDGTRRMYIIFGTMYIKTAIKEVAYHLNINGNDYSIVHIEEQLVLPRIGKSYIRVTDYKGAILVHPTGKFYERKLFRTAGSVYAKPLGIMFAEYDYISSESNWYA